MPYPVTYPPSAADEAVVDLSGASCPRLSSPREVARRLAELDEAYVRGQFAPLDELAAPRGVDHIRGLIAEGRLPQPAYRLDDGTDWVPEDYFAPLDAAGGVERLREWFRDEYARAARAAGAPHEETDVAAQWANYLTGGYFVCLQHATPRAIAEKAARVTAIEALLESPRPYDSTWARQLRDEVESLAAIERAGSPLDPPRWGGPMSPQWYGAYLRGYFPQAFSGAERSGS